jgi:hypothetical protein
VTLLCGVAFLQPPRQNGAIAFAFDLDFQSRVIKTITDRIGDDGLAEGS